MTYDDLLRDLWAMGRGKGMRLGLDRVRAASERLGNPAQAYPAVHVAGTNGKGSVCHVAARILRAHGLRVGLTTSPHLHRLTERVLVDGDEVGGPELADVASSVRGRLGGWEAFDLTFFEVVTLLAFEVFRRRRVDVAVVEVGMGGRLDATRLCRPAVCAITTIGLDHTEHLGPTIPLIAAEKAGIIVPGAPVVLGHLVPEAREVIVRRAREVGAEVVDPPPWDGDAPLPGEHQRANAAVAASAAAIALRAAGIEPDRALLRPAPFVVPGRLELLRGDPPVLFDVAHNPQGAASLAAHLERSVGPARLVLGTMGTKDHAGILAALRPAARHLHACAPRMPGAVAPGRLAESWPGPSTVHEGPVEAFDAAVAAARTAGETVVVTGSHYVVCEARAAALGIADVDGPIAL